MNFKPVVAAAVLAGFGATAFADDTTATFVDGVARFDSVGTVLDGGDDVITFDGLADGVYNFTLTLSGQDFTISSADLNGTTGVVFGGGPIVFLGITGTDSPQFTLTLAGTVTGSKPVYSGELTVAAVPEPETYALMLAGLAAVGFVARRRRT